MCIRDRSVPRSRADRSSRRSAATRTVPNTARAAVCGACPRCCRAENAGSPSTRAACGRSGERLVIERLVLRHDDAGGEPLFGVLSDAATVDAIEPADRGGRLLGRLAYVP